MKENTYEKSKGLGLMSVGAIAVVFSVILTGAISWALYNHTVNLLTDNLRQRLLAITTTAVVTFDSNDINALQEEEDYLKPEWNRVVNQLLKIENNNKDIVFAYIYRKKSEDPTQLEFVADSHSLNPYANVDDDPNNDVDANGDGVVEPDGPDYLQWPGQDYEEPPADTFRAFEGALTNQELYEDSFGQVITGYAPIKDENGNVVAVLAVDIRAGDFFTITRQTLYPFIGFIIVLTLILIILSWILIATWNKRVALLAELDRQKDELLSIVSHQLATPVASVKWYLEMLQDGDLGPINKEQKEHVTSMQGITTNLADLVSMILDVSRIQLGRMHIEKQELDLKELIDEILIVVKPKAEAKNINFTINVPKNLPKAKLDKRYTRMTIENLLSNAIKYTPEGGSVIFTISIHGNELKCEVKDTGCGIPKYEHAQIFGKLFRASNVRNSIDGNGFGLYVAKGAIEAQGGQIGFESEENKGTKFFMSLPL